MKVGIIDVGSNSVRLAIMADGKTLYKRLNTTRLGEGISASGNLCAEAIERTAQAVLNFYTQAQQDGADKIYIFATAAVRCAQNRNLFLNRVKELCGENVDVVSGEAEAKMGIFGALGNSDGGIIDVGGASTEVIVRKNGEYLYSESVNIGTVRLFDAAKRDKIKLSEIISAAVEEYGCFSAHGFKICAIGGTATRLAAIKHKLKEYRPDITHGTKLTLKELDELSDSLLTMPVEEIRANTICGKSAELVGGGALLLSSVMRKFGISEVIVSESDNLEGYYALKERTE